MFRKTALLSVAALFVAGAASGLAPDAKKKSKVTHVYVCPISGKASKESKETGMYGKYMVHFCCDKCKAPFDKLSKKEQEAKIKTAMKPAKPAKKTAEAGGAKLVSVNTCPITGENAASAAGGPSTVGNYKVNFCCAGCKP